MKPYGTLYGIGVGPGDPELITVKAVRLLRETPVIAMPKKKHDSDSYAQKIVEMYVEPDKKEVLLLVFPMTKDRDLLEREWNNTVNQLWERLREGKDVAFITEGDPMFYSTFIHLMREMNAQHPEVDVQSVAGLSAFLGAASRLNLPLAESDEQIGIIPATDNREAMRQALVSHDCVVFLKVGKVLDLILSLLRELDLLDKASVVTKVTSTDEMICRDVRQLEGTELGYLSLMVVRK